MTDQTARAFPGASNPGSLVALHQLVEDLIRVDVVGVDGSDDGSLGAEFRIGLQDLVTLEMNRSDSTPDLATILSAALTKWASSR